MEGAYWLPFHQVYIIQQARLDVPLTGCSKEHKDSAQRERSHQHCPAAGKQHFTQSIHVHEPELNSISPFTHNSHWAMAALVFVRAISLPFPLTSQDIIHTVYVWSSALSRSVHFLGLRRSHAHTDLTITNKSILLCLKRKENHEMNSKCAERCENLHLKRFKVMIYWCTSTATVLYNSHKSKHQICFALGGGGGGTSRCLLCCLPMTSSSWLQFYWTTVHNIITGIRDKDN